MIDISADGTVFVLSTANSSYAFAVDPAGLLRHLHWGGRVPDAADFDAPALWDLSTNDPLMDVTPEEYPVHGQFRYAEQCLAVQFADGTRELRMAVTGHTVQGEDGGGELVVTLLDDRRGVAVDLHYRCHEALDLIERWAVIANRSDEPISITSAFSAQFHVPFEGLNFRNVHGLWAAEQQPFVQPVSFGKVVVESRRGISTHHHNPYFVLDRDATETTGGVWFGALRLGGNFKAVVEQTQHGDTLVQIGVNDYDFGRTLGPGEHWITPAVVAGYAADGLGGMSARMHAFGRSLMRPEIRPVLYNSWEATGFTVTAGNQIALAGRAADVGAELFVVDDGWFGRRGSDDDGLGDWWVNREKFPDGLQPLVEAVQGLGMRFGIWVEPEMVNPASDLYREHPEWIYREPDREPDPLRNQYVLDLGRRDVQDFVVGMLDDLLGSYDIAYVKWDANRPTSHVGARTDAALAHTEALYDVVGRIRERHPDVLIEACASGGGRIDFGALTVFDDFWTSDNTDAYDRLEIQRGYSYLYPIKAMRAWVTDSPNFLTQRAIPLKFRFHSAMMGTLGIGADLTKFSDDELAEATQLVAQYKEIRETIQNGTFFRLDNPSPNDYRLFQYARPEQSVVFAFLPATRVGRRSTRIRLHGLEPRARYRFSAEWRHQERSGAYLMERGIPLWLLGDYVSEIITFDRLV